MAREFRDITWAVENRLTKRVRKNERIVNITTPRPCPRCNSGWMSDLEREAQPILTPLIHGDAKTLNPADQLTMGRWFFLRSVVFDLHCETSTPRPRYFEDTEYRVFMEHSVFFPHYMVFAGCYAGSERIGLLQEDHSAIKLVTPAGETVSDDIRVYALTLAFKHLVLQICCAKVPASSFIVETFQDHCVQLGTGSPVEWPPKQPLGDGLIERFVFRWSDIKPPG